LTTPNPYCGCRTFWPMCSASIFMARICATQSKNQGDKFLEMK
jgi:hypothetical protein